MIVIAQINLRIRLTTLCRPTLALLLSPPKFRLKPYHTIVCTITIAIPAALCTILRLPVCLRHPQLILLRRLLPQSPLWGLGIIKLPHPLRLGMRHLQKPDSRPVRLLLSSLYHAPLELEPPEKISQKETSADRDS
jgi:hypothetical protein